MTSETGADDPDLALFREIIAGLEPDDLPAVVDQLRGAATIAAPRAARPDLRRPAPSTCQAITVRVDLHHAAPPIWRRLELRSDLTLAEVHDMLQVAFGWTGYHLWRFAAGGHPFDRTSQLFLCPFDVDEGEDEGIPADEVHLGELLQQRGDQIGYVYDYGDDWELKIRVESVREASEDTPRARAIGGRRAAPPEDSGGITDAESLAEVLPDPSHFDLEGLNQALEAEARGVAAHEVHPALADVLALLEGTPAAFEVSLRLIEVASAPETPGDDELQTALGPVLWFLHRADDGGIPLTQAGYMAPDVVVAASDIVPDQDTWYGKNNRETLAVHVLALREALQSVKLLRKFKGRLLPTRRAAGVARDPRAVWELLVESLIPEKAGFARDATALLLLHVASTHPGRDVSFDDIGEELTQRGWRVGGGPVGFSSIRDLPAVALLRSLTAQKRELGTGIESFSSVARILAASVLAPARSED
ncbi:plasmid pRiA4b ORF-3 family protein [Brachybacterium alimentarium]|uniref:plasmid pRiA4b ORF-3 family protein n=1 Tax=Brachybacterium alimentarium TaxID=47845 RepID=UPI0031DF5EEE